MLLYIQNKAYPGRTFVELCSASDTVARIRANLLHQLYVIGHATHQFRLRHKETYLRDAYTLEEYKILNNAVITVVPLDNPDEWNKDMMLSRWEEVDADDTVADDSVQQQLQQEVKFLNTREKILTYYKVLLMAQVVFALLGFFTAYWYYSFAYTSVILVALVFTPTFSRTAGWMGKNSVRRKEYMLAMLVLTILLTAASTTLFSLSLIKVTTFGYPTADCADNYDQCVAGSSTDNDIVLCQVYQARCYETSVWTSVYFGMVTTLLLITGVLSAVLLHNLNFENGDLIEKCLVQTRELETVLSQARDGNLSRKRAAAFELATMAASADTNKFDIVAEEGLEVLISLALSDDVMTQEYATEAIAECLTVPAIQDRFVSIGGVRTLTALLHAKHPRTTHEAITALFYITTDSDHNKMIVVADHGLDDISFACKQAKPQDRKLLASILLELSSYDHTRSALASWNSPTESLVELLRRSSECEVETIALSLQALELLAIQSPFLLSSQPFLLDYMLTISTKCRDAKIDLLSCKLLLYLAQDPQSRDEMCNSPELTDHLLYLARTNDDVMLHTLAQICVHLTMPYKHRQMLTNEGFVELLQYLQSSSNDRESWNMADQALTNLQNAEDMQSDEPDKLQLRSRSTSVASSSSSRDQPAFTSCTNAVSSHASGSSSAC